ncbi:MAG: hypothetical protein ACJAXH_001020 [Colwellia sp.]|jgi:hypothetical protein
MNFKGLSPQIKTGFAGWIKCKLFKELKTEVGQKTYHSDMFFIESLSQILSPTERKTFQ